MGKRNSKVKQIKAGIEGDIQALKNHIQGLEDDILELHEENSELRKHIDLQSDCFKARESRLQWEIAALKKRNKDIAFCIQQHNKAANAQLDFSKKLIKNIEKDRDKLRKVTDEVIRIGNGLQDAAETVLGRLILKCFGKGR